LMVVSGLETTPTTTIEKSECEKSYRKQQIQYRIESLTIIIHSFIVKAISSSSSLLSSSSNAVMMLWCVWSIFSLPVPYTILKSLLPTEGERERARERERFWIETLPVTASFITIHRQRKEKK